MTCIYCQVSPAVTADHVPPKSMFTPPYPANLITVPSCRACNASFQMDDDYFRATIVMRADLSVNNHALAVLDRTMRSLQRSEAAGLRERFVRSLTKKDVWSRDGVLLGQAGAYEVENDRLVRTLSRIVRGLYYHETRSPLPPGIEIRAHITLQEDQEMRADALKMIEGRPIATVGPVFRYAWVQAPGYPSFTCWILEFFELVPFFVASVDPSVMNRAGAGQT